MERAGIDGALDFSMTQEEFDSLDRGDILRHASGDSYVVSQKLSNSLIAVRTIEAANPAEWELYSSNIRQPGQFQERDGKIVFVRKEPPEPKVVFTFHDFSNTHLDDVPKHK